MVIVRCSRAWLSFPFLFLYIYMHVRVKKSWHKPPRTFLHTFIGSRAHTYIQDEEHHSRQSLNSFAILVWVNSSSVSSTHDGFWKCTGGGSLELARSWKGWKFQFPFGWFDPKANWGREGGTWTSVDCPEERGREGEGLKKVGSRAPRRPTNEPSRASFPGVCAEFVAN